MASLIKQAGVTVKKIGAMRDEMLHNIWLAGLGAYAKSAEEVENLSARSQSLFDELIARGKSVEESTKAKVSAAASQTGDALEQRVQQLVQKAAGLDPARFDEMNRKLDKLAKQVETLVAHQKTAVQPAATKAEMVAMGKVAPPPAVARPAAKRPAPKRPAVAKEAKQVVAAVAKEGKEAVATAVKTASDKVATTVAKVEKAVTES